MKSAHTMLVGTLLAVLLGGCASTGPELVAPRVIPAPYDTARGDVLWAVVPLRNDSGASFIDVMDVSDQVVAACESVPGVRCLPINRTIAAMRVLGMSSLDSPDEAKRLAREMGADGVVVGSITAWDPYTPTLGISLALYALPGAMDSSRLASIDSRWLTYQPTDYQYFSAGVVAEGDPASTVSELYDGDSDQTLMEVRSWAEGRHDRASALGWRRYVASMVLFTKFAAHGAVDRLIQHEWIRLAGGAEVAQG